MITVLTIIHILCALILILVVLLQSAKGTDLAGAFGGMGSQTAFGPRGTTTFLSKTTAVLAAIFMVTSVSLAVLSNRIRRGASVLSGEKTAPITQPATPAPLPSAPGQTIPQPTVKVIPPPTSGGQTATPAPATPPASSPPKASPPAGGSKPESSGASSSPAEVPSPSAPATPQPSGQ
jgi:preprotein translocase subunit SecG